MDLLAARLARDPVALRLQNALRPCETNAVGVPVEPGTDIAACLTAAKDHPFWAGREAWKRAAPPFVRRGVGLVSMASGDRAWLTRGTSRASIPENFATHSYTAKVLSAVTMASPGPQKARMTELMTSQEPLPTRNWSGDLPKRSARAWRRS